MHRHSAQELKANINMNSNTKVTLFGPSSEIKAGILCLVIHLTLVYQAREDLSA